MSFFNKIKQNNAPNCTACGEFKDAVNPRMGVQGKGEKGILVLTKCPSKKQDQTGNLFEGEATAFFKKELKALGIELERDCWVVPVCGCNTNKESNQLKKTIEHCRPRIESIIKDLKPKFIWAMGNSALESLFGAHLNNLTVEIYRRYCIPSYNHDAFVVALFHPLEAMMNVEDEFWISVYRRDLQTAINWLDKKLPRKPNFESKVHCLTDFNEICKLLDYIITIKPKYLVRDYEGTGTDLFIPESRLESISLAYIQDAAKYNYHTQEAYSFPLERKGIFTQEQIAILKEKWVAILECEAINKIAHNFALERVWEHHHLKAETSENDHDSMVACHLENPVSGTKSLKFNAFVRFGMLGYGDEVKAFFENKYENGLNKIDQYPLGKLLLYGGYDSLFNIYLFMQQYEYFKLGSRRKNSEKEALKWYNKIAIVMAELHEGGVKIDLEYLKEQKTILSAEIIEIDEKIAETKEVLTFIEKEGRTPNISSDHDLRKMFFTHGDFESIKQTKSGGDSVDKEVMHSIESECAKLILERREIDKIINTYIAQFERLHVDGFLHGYFHMHIARTLRSSSTQPNLQNLSARNIKQKTAIRGMIKPDSDDCYFMEADLSGVEILQNAVICKDPYLLQLLQDNTIDMHSMFVKHCYDMTDFQVTKKIRNPHKMNWTFAQAYGSNYYACARKTWEWMHSEKVETGDGILLQEHLAIRGIKTERDFIDYWKVKEEEYWAMFPVWREWQQNCFDEYLTTGRIKTPSGYYRSDILTKNKILNTGAQNGGAFCLLTAKTYVRDEIKRRKLKTRLLLQVHDSIGASVHKDEAQEFLDLVYYALTVWTKERFPYLLVPLGAEIEMTPELGQAWLYKKPWEKVDGVWQVKQ